MSQARGDTMVCGCIAESAICQMDKLVEASQSLSIGAPENYT